jgi:hypothetical protein
MLEIKSTQLTPHVVLKYVYDYSIFIQFHHFNLYSPRQAQFHKIGDLVVLLNCSGLCLNYLTG